MWINSSNKEIFDNTKEDYQKKLDKSSFKPNFHIKKATKVATVETVTGYKTTVKFIVNVIEFGSNLPLTKLLSYTSPKFS